MQLPLFLISHSITKEEAWDFLGSSLCLIMGWKLGEDCPKLYLEGEIMGLRGIEGSHNSEIWRSGGGHGEDILFCPQFFL